MDPRTRGALMVLAAAFLWGTLGVVFRLLGHSGVSAVATGFWRAALGFAALGLWIAVRNPAGLRIQRRDVPFFALWGLVCVGIFFALYPLAVQLTSVAVAVVLLYTAPAWVAAMGALFLGERLTVRRVGALVLCFVGVGLVAGLHDASALAGNLPGLLAGLGAGLTYACLSIFGRMAPDRYDVISMSFFITGFGLLVLGAAALADPADLGELWADPRSIALMLYAGIVPTAGSAVLYTGGLRMMGDAGRASILATLEPLMGALLAFAVLGEALAPVQLAGGGLVLAGVLVLQAPGS